MQVLPVVVPDILLPSAQVDYEKWGVVACDQFTSEPNYWGALATYIGNASSTLHLTFPEVYLSSDNAKRIDLINQTMKDYVEKQVFSPPFHGFLLTERITAYGRKRVGMILAVDLDAYSFHSEDKALIRATEGTILERIPPRVQIRKNALLELPHIILLLDDACKQIIEPIYAARNKLKQAYQVHLNMNGGSLTSWYVPDTAPIMNAFQRKLDDMDSDKKADSFLFAVGDGNHSLATAKSCWEACKVNLSKEQQQTHPARYALVEVENIYDDGLQFEPIHRLLMGVDSVAMTRINQLRGGHSGICVQKNGNVPLHLPDQACEAVTLVQQCIDELLAQGHVKQVDYIHGRDSLTQVVNAQVDSVGVLLAPMNKSELFSAVSKYGALARKTFSMGEATEKRYYFECRKITR